METQGELKGIVATDMPLKVPNNFIGPEHLPKGFSLHPLTEQGSDRYSNRNEKKRKRLNYDSSFSALWFCVTRQQLGGRFIPHINGRDPEGQITILQPLEPGFTHHHRKLFLAGKFDYRIRQVLVGTAL